MKGGNAPDNFSKKRFLKGIFRPSPASEPAEEETAAVEAQRAPLLKFSPCPWGVKKQHSGGKK